MKTIDHLQTMALTYQEICQGEQPWVALGNFMNDWFDYAKDRRAQLIADPITLPASPTSETLRWTAFCAASVEWFCERYHIPCPQWVHNPTYILSEAWFSSPWAHKPEVRLQLIQQTPESFSRRNIYCGKRMFLNKWELAEEHKKRKELGIFQQM